MRNQSKFNNKSNSADVVFMVFFDSFEWILTPSSIIFILNFQSVFVYWAKTECCFFIKKIYIKFKSKRGTDELVPVLRLYYIRKPEVYFQPSPTSAMEPFCGNS